MDIQFYLNKFVELFKGELSENLVGIYLHGSLAMNCFNPKGSDIEFIIVVRDKLKRENTRNIARKVLDLHDEMPNERGMEFSVILENHLKPFKYPTPIEFHYSDFHRERYRTDENYLCGGFEDEDLASQLMVAYNRGKCLYGTPLEILCEPINKKYFIASIYHDVKGAMQEVIENPVYVILNLCRVLYYLKEDQVSSKKEGGEWGIETLPEEYQVMITDCLDKYTGATDEIKLDNQLQLQFVDYMLNEINHLI